MLECKPVKSLGVVNGRQDRARPPVFQIGQDLLPHLDQHVRAATPLNASELIELARNFLARPVKHKGFHYFAEQFGA